MSDKLGLCDLLNEIGSENMSMQLLDEAVLGMKMRKDDTEITFITDQLLGLSGTERLGIVVWIDRDAEARARNKLMAS